MVLLGEETGVPENYLPAATGQQVTDILLSHNVVSSTLHHEWDSN